MSSASITDSFEKESKFWKFPMIVFVILACLCPLSLIMEETKIQEFIVQESFFLLAVVYFLYAFCWAKNYHVLVFDNRIIIKTLFKRKEIGIGEVTSYSCKKYRKTVFYQFELHTGKSKTILYTRFKDDFEKILNATQ